MGEMERVLASPMITPYMSLGLEFGNRMERKIHVAKERRKIVWTDR